MAILKSNFKVLLEYKSFYTVGNNIETCHDGEHFICHFNSLDHDCLNLVTNSECNIVHNILEEQEKITTFTVSKSEEFVITSSYDLILKKINWRSREVLRCWKSYHTQPVIVLAIDAFRLVSGSGDRNIRLWHIGPGEGLTKSCRGHKDRITFFKFHPTKTAFLSSAATDSTLRMWDSESGTSLGVFTGHQSHVTDVLFILSTDEMLSCARDFCLLLWNFSDYQVKRRFPCSEIFESCALLSHPHLINDALKSNVNHVLLAGQNGTLAVWNIERGKIVLELQSLGGRCPKNEGVNGIIRMVQFSQHLYLIVRSNGNFEFYDCSSLKLQKEWSSELGEIRDLTFCGDGYDLLMAEASSYLRLYRIASCLEREAADVDVVNSTSCHAVWAHADGVLCIAAAVKSEKHLEMTHLVASGGKDCAVRVWLVKDTKKSSQRLCLVAEAVGHRAHVSAVSFDIACRRLITGDEEGSLYGWDLISSFDETVCPRLISYACHIKAHQDVVNNICVSNNGSLVASSSRDRTVRLWTANDLVSLGSLSGHTRGVWCSDFSPKESCIVTAGSDSTIRLWQLKYDKNEDKHNLLSSCLTTLQEHDCPVYKVRFISHGNQLLSCDQNGLIKLWTLLNNNTNANCVRTFEVHEGRLWAFALNTTETCLVTGGQDARLIVWRDTSEEDLILKRKQNEAAVILEQKLSGLVRGQEWTRALEVAVHLDKPHRALSILEQIEWLPEQKDRETVLKKVSKTTLRKLLLYALHWNSNARNFWIAQRLVHFFLSQNTPEQLLEWQPELNRLINEFLPYTQRHQRRLEALSSQLTYIDWMIESMRSQATSSEEIV